MTTPPGYLRSGRWIPLLAFVALMAIACVLLGRWQVDRLEQRRAKNAAVVEAERQAPTDVRALASDAKAGSGTVDFRPVTATGSWGNSVAVRNRSLEGKNGVLVIAPLRTQDDVVWVVRGWLPPGPDARTPPALPQTARDQVTVEGLARSFETGSDGTALPPGFVGRISAEDLAQVGPESTVPFWVQALTEDPVPSPAPEPLGTPALSEGPHLGYAVQWAAFAIMALVGGVVLVRRQRAFYAEDMAAAAARPNREE